jgi:hypothetical protein
MANNEAEELLELLFRQSQMQFGSAIKSRWMHDGDGCPGCGREIDATKYKGKDTLSINAFIFREHGVLIAYFLCGRCAKKILNTSQANASGTTDLHVEIEKTLKKAFLRHLGH